MRIAENETLKSLDLVGLPRMGQPWYRVPGIKRMEGDGRRRSASDQSLLRRDGQLALHVRMKFAKIFKRAGLLGDEAALLVRRQKHVPGAVRRRRGVLQDVLVVPLDRVADLPIDLGRREHEFVGDHFDGGRLRRDGAEPAQKSGDDGGPSRLHGVSPDYFSAASTCSACCSWP